MEPKATPTFESILTLLVQTHHCREGCQPSGWLTPGAGSVRGASQPYAQQTHALEPALIYCSSAQVWL